MGPPSHAPINAAAKSSRHEAWLGAVPLGLAALALVLARFREGVHSHHVIQLAMTSLLALEAALSVRLRGHDARWPFLRDAHILASISALAAVLMSPPPGWTCVPAALLLGVSVARLLEDVVSLKGLARSAAQGAGWLLPIGAFVAGALFLFSRGSVELSLDSESYVSAARQPLGSPELWGGARAPLFPLALKLFANPPDFDGLVRFQLLFGTVAWVVLALAVSRSVRRPWLGALAILVILRIGAGRDLLFWHKHVLSESLSLSLQALVLAALCHSVVRGLEPTPSRRRQAALAGLVLGPAAPWVLVRDSNAYLLLAGTGSIGLLLVMRPVARQREAWFWGTLAAGFVALFLVANVSSSHGRRWQFPLVNVLGQRILADPELARELAARGMPMGPAALRFRGKWASDNDSDWSGFQPWLDERAKGDYTRWLLGRPTRSLLEPLLDWQAVSASTTFYSRLSAAPGWQAAGQPVFELPASEFLGALGAALGFGALAIRRRGLSRRFGLQAVLLAVVYTGVFVAWHGDAMEIARHSLGAMVLARITIWCTILFALDALLEEEPGPSKGMPPPLS